jgi:NAD(P)-dependent dehydrogenase (short-subunit alcohol dehydrogenase family)
MCDVMAENMEETRKLCEQQAPAGTRISVHECDVSVEPQVLAFRDAVVREQRTDHVNLLFNNAGIAGGGSFVTGEREEWEKTFGVCWSGVYFCCRAFVPLVVASSEGHIVNTSSVNGFWASIGPLIPHTAYSAAKFAVKGFSEALLTDLRLNAPHVSVSVVMPGHVGTSIGINTGRVLGLPSPKEMTESDLAKVRERWGKMGLPMDGLDDDELRAAIEQRQIAFRDDAPLSAEGAATIILDGVRANEWRILVGEDAKRLDERVRKSPWDVYDPDFSGLFG